jgi:hypothetical protein
MLLSITFALLVSSPQAADEGPNLLVRIPSRDPRQLASDLVREGFDVLHEVLDADERVGVVVSPTERRLLEARGLVLEVEATGRPLRDSLPPPDPGDGVVPGGYPDLAGILAALNNFAAAHPTLARVVDVTASYGLAPTFQGRHLYALVISDNVAVDEDEPSFLLVAAHHCREIVTPVIALDTIDRLLTGYATNPAIRAAVDGHEIWIAPIWNPDGYNHVFNVDNLWRKNRRTFAGGTGVDLNRNYPFGWSNACAGSSTPSSSTYRGPSPASEAETITLMALSEAQRFEKVIDYHSTGRETLWGYACPTAPIDAFWQQEATTLSQSSSYGGAERRPSADGEHYHWQFVTYGSMSFLTETHSQFQPSYASAVTEAADVWPGTFWLLQRPMPLRGHVTHACTGAPLAATIAYVSPVFTSGEASSSEPTYGRYHAFLPPGSHLLRFEAPGFAPRTVPAVLSAGATTVLDVALTPLSTAGTTFCPATPNSTGQVPTIRSNGATSLGQNQLQLTVDRLPTQESAVFLLGQNQVQIPMFAGVLCLGRPAHRLGLMNTGATGNVQSTLDLSQSPLALSAGTTVAYQLYYRDLAAGGTARNYSPALWLTFCP